MKANLSESNPVLSPEEIGEICAKIQQLALDHLMANDANSALSYYAAEAIIISQGAQIVFEDFVKDTETFYEDLKEVVRREWQNPSVLVLSQHLALFSAGVTWYSLDRNNQTLQLKGHWSALYRKTADDWKITFRHESFSTSDFSTQSPE